jgi:hypothetical protein
VRSSDGNSQRSHHRRRRLSLSSRAAGQHQIVSRRSSDRLPEAAGPCEPVGGRAEQRLSIGRGALAGTVLRCPQNANRAHDEDEQNQRYEGMGTVQGDFDNPHRPHFARWRRATDRLLLCLRATSLPRSRCTHPLEKCTQNANVKWLKRKEEACRTAQQIL